MNLGISIGLPKAMATRLAGLRTPDRIQDFVTGLRWNYQTDGPTALSVTEVLRQRHAHCIEGAFVAACTCGSTGTLPC